MISKTGSKLSELKQMMGRTRRPNKFDLPTSGRISMSQINEELGNAPMAQLSLRAAANEFGIPTGQVGLRDFYGLSSKFSNVMRCETDGGRYGYHAEIPNSDLEPPYFHNAAGNLGARCTALYTIDGESVFMNIETSSSMSFALEFHTENGDKLAQYVFTFNSSSSAGVLAPDLGEYLLNSVGRKCLIIDLNEPRNKL